MPLTLSVDLPPDRVLYALVLDALAAKLANAFGRAVPAIRRGVGLAATRAVKACPEYESLLGGELRGELGVADARPVLNAICNNVADGVVVTSLGARRAGQNVEGGIRIELLKGDYSEVLGVPGDSFVSEGGYQVDWLRWLTLEGDRVLVADHRFVAGKTARSRTGMGVMQQPGSWRVPPEFSGTAADNWLTRALASIGPAVETVLAEEIQKRL